MGFSSFEMNRWRHRLARRLPQFEARILNPSLRRTYMEIVGACSNLSMAGHRAQDVQALFSPPDALNGPYLDEERAARLRFFAICGIKREQLAQELPTLHGLEHLMLIWDRALRQELVPPPLLPCPRSSDEPAGYPNLGRLILSDLTTHQDSMRSMLEAFAQGGKLRALEAKYIEVCTTDGSDSPNPVLLRVTPDRWLTSAPTFASGLTRLVLQDCPRLEGSLAELLNLSHLTIDPACLPLIGIYPGCLPSSLRAVVLRSAPYDRPTVSPWSFAQTVWELLNATSPASSARNHVRLAKHIVGRGIPLAIPPYSPTRHVEPLASLQRITIEASVNSHDHERGAMGVWTTVAFILQELGRQRGPEGEGVTVDVSLVCAWWKDGDSFDALFHRPARTPVTAAKESVDRVWRAARGLVEMMREPKSVWKLARSSTMSRAPTPVGQAV